jgi:stage V sporulation protein G
MKAVLKNNTHLLPAVRDTHRIGCKTSRKGGMVMDNSVEINVERLYRLDTDGALRGFADISICNSLVVKGLRIIAGKNGMFVGMPRQLGKDGKWHNRVSLINESLKDKLNNLVLSAFEDE